MLALTHVLFAAVFALIILSVFTFSHPIHFFLLFCFAALLPDIDHSGSIFGRKIWPVSWAISFIFGHRGLLHSVFIPVILLFLGWYFQVFWIGLAIAGGYLTHIVIDMLTISGVKPFGIGPRIRGLVRTGGMLEIIIFIFMIIFFVWIFFQTI